MDHFCNRLGSMLVCSVLGLVLEALAIISKVCEALSPTVWKTPGRHFCASSSPKVFFVGYVPHSEKHMDAGSLTNSANIKRQMLDNIKAKCAPKHKHRTWVHITTSDSTRPAMACV